MCLTITQLEPKIADKDIICYKHVRRTKIKGIYISSGMGFEYIIRQLYTNNLDIKYVNFIIKKRYNMFIIEENMFHSFSKYLPTMSTLSSNYVALKCIIPKGSYYFEGYLNSILCYASSQIKILEEI